jgi:hypothetical protein
MSDPRCLPLAQIASDPDENSTEAYFVTAGQDLISPSNEIHLRSYHVNLSTKPSSENKIRVVIYM